MVFLLPFLLLIKSVFVNILNIYLDNSYNIIL